MNHSALLRNLTFVVMLGATWTALQMRVLASGFDDPYTNFSTGFCHEWEDGDGYDCTDCPNIHGTEPDFYANGSCDFSGIEDEELRLFTAAAYVQEAGDACDETCGDGYRDYLIDWFRGNYPYDPCYDAWEEPSDWSTWSDPGGSAGSYSTWSCTCDYFFFGFC